VGTNGRDDGEDQRRNGFLLVVSVFWDQTAIVIAKGDSSLKRGGFDEELREERSEIQKRCYGTSKGETHFDHKGLFERWRKKKGAGYKENKWDRVRNLSRRGNLKKSRRSKMESEHCGGQTEF